MMSYCIDWGPRSTSKGDYVHVHCKHIQGVWEHSYSVAVEMDPPVCHLMFVLNLGSWRNSRVTPGLHMMSWCTDWGSRSTSNDSHIHSKHKRFWEHSYAGDGEMDPPSCLFHHDCSSQINWDGGIHGSHFGYIWCHGALIEAPDPHRMIPTSTPIIYEVFESIHKLWMGRWIHHHASSTIFMKLKFRELAEFMGHTLATYDVMVLPFRPQTHMKLFQLHSKHVQCVWEHSYAVDGEMDPPSCLFHHDCSSQINWNTSRNLRERGGSIHPRLWRTSVNSSTFASSIQNIYWNLPKQSDLDSSQVKLRVIPGRIKLTYHRDNRRSACDWGDLLCVSSCGGDDRHKHSWGQWRI
jgi:hypothetical protein